MKNENRIDQYFAINKESWNARVDTHVNSAFYEMDAFLKGDSSLREIELNLLGNIQGLSVLHLQCHFGQDSISLARMGASNVYGVDISDKAIEKAILLAKETKTNARFICCNVYDLPEHLDETFDIVFTSYGTIGWLPDLDKWSAVISKFLKPGGRFIFVEFHPVVWMFDNDFREVSYNYFKKEPIIETESGTYADRQADIEKKTVSWNHGIGEVCSSLLHTGLRIDSLQEFDYSPYNCFRHTKSIGKNRYIIEHLHGRIPMVYALCATKQ